MKINIFLIVNLLLFCNTFTFADVQYPMMTNNTKHLSIHVYTKELALKNRKVDLEFLKNNIKIVATNIKKSIFGSQYAKTTYSGPQGNVQLAVQVGITPLQFILYFDGNVNKTVSYLKTIIETFEQEGFSIHLLIGSHSDLGLDNPNLNPDENKKIKNWLTNTKDWNQINWQSEQTKWNYERSSFVPFQPCLFENRPDGTPCPYDVIFKNMHTPIIKELDRQNLLTKLAVIYIFNEFDYDYSKSPQVNNWVDICKTGQKTLTLEDIKTCRMIALASTTRRGLVNASNATKRKVPVGIKLFYTGGDLWDDKGKQDPINEHSAWKPITTGKYKGMDLLVTLLEEFPYINGLLGYDCYWGEDSFWRVNSYWKNDNTCMEDRQRIESILKNKGIIDYFSNGHIEIAEYARYCNGSPDKLKTKSGRTTPNDMFNIVEHWSSNYNKDYHFTLNTSGFNLFAYNVYGETDGCYALATKDTLKIFDSAKDMISKGIIKQICLITGLTTSFCPPK